MNQISKNDAIALWLDYKSYLSTYINDSIIDSINKNLSGIMLSCKLLFVFGTGTTVENNQDGIAVLNVSYESMNVPTSTSTSSMIDLYTDKYNAGHTQKYDNLSAHYSRLAFNDDITINTNLGISFLTSDIIKLSFNEPVATSARVMTMINLAVGNTADIIKIHNNWTTEIINVLPTWLESMPHKHLFLGVSSFITNSLSLHNTSIDAHSELLSKYSTKVYTQNLLTSLISTINEESNRSVSAQTLMWDLFLLTSAQFRYLLDYHTISAINLPNYPSAHVEIFLKYDRRWLVDLKDLAVREYVRTRVNHHLSAGTVEHPNLASKINPYFQGTIYLNYPDTHQYCDWYKENTFKTLHGDDNDPHAIMIKTSKNDFAKIGSFLTTTGIDCGGLLIQTGDNGNLPIRVLQTNNNNPTNIAYILDSNGNTLFPNTVSGRNIILSDSNLSSNFSGPVKIDNYAVINTLALNNRSTIQLHDLPSSNSSTYIPNTLWVHRTVSGLARLFVVSAFMQDDNVEYNPLAPCSGNITKHFIDQKFGFLRNIYMNPKQGRVRCNILSSHSLNTDTGNITAVNADTITSYKIINANKIKATGNISGCCYYGTDKDGYELNERSKVNPIETKTSAGTAQNIDYPLVAIKPENSSYFKDYSVKKSKHELVYAKANTSDKKYPLSFNPYTNTINAENFNGTALRARWADLALIYLTDIEYPIGTLIQFGGLKLITIASKKINGVISDKPAYLMNSNGKGQPIALVGKVAVRVIGKVSKFDYIGLSDINGVGISLGTEYTDKIIGIALLTNNNLLLKLVLCSVQLHL